MEEISLKPCPFCAGKADVAAISVDENNPNWMVFIFCRKCGVATSIVRSQDRDAAIYKSAGKWNTRA